jgi:hypothetical protein
MKRSDSENADEGKQKAFGQTSGQKKARPGRGAQRMLEEKTKSQENFRRDIAPMRAEKGYKRVLSQLAVVLDIGRDQADQLGRQRDDHFRFVSILPKLFVDRFGKDLQSLLTVGCRCRDAIAAGHCLGNQLRHSKPSSQKVAPTMSTGCAKLGIVASG